MTLSSIGESASPAVLGRMQPTQLNLHATRRTPHRASQGLVQAMSAWSVKARHAPSRHCRDARVYGHTTTAMRDIEYTPPPPPPVSYYLRLGTRSWPGRPCITLADRAAWTLPFCSCRTVLTSTLRPVSGARVVVVVVVRGTIVNRTYRTHKILYI